MVPPNLMGSGPRCYNKAGQASQEDKPVSSTPPSPQYQFLPRVSTQNPLDDGLQAVRRNKPLFSQVLSHGIFVTSIEKELIQVGLLRVF